MRIPDWTPQAQPQPSDLVDAILARRGGTLINLDKVLLWSEPVARGWNHYMGNVRTKLSGSNRLRELGICTVALLTGASYEYHHHAPEYLKAGGTQADLDALASFARAPDAPPPAALGELESLVARYAAQMTRQVKVDDALFAQVQQRFDTPSLVELTVTIAAYNMVARILMAFHVTPEGEGSGAPLTRP